MVKKVLGVLLTVGSFLLGIADPFTEDSFVDAALIESSKIMINVTQAEAPLCSVGDTGSLTCIIQGGVPPYSAALIGGATSVSPITNISMNSTETFRGLGASAIPYFVVVIDADGNTATSGSITLWPADPINITVSPTPTSCFGGENGSMSVTVTDAVAPATIILKDSSMSVKTIPDVSNGDTQTISGLTAGLYSLTVIGADRCSTTVPVNVQSGPGPLTFTVKTCKTSCPKKQRKLRVQATGGTAPYSYQLDEGAFQNNGSFGCVKKGNHTVTVKDANGCIATECIGVPNH